MGTTTTTVEVKIENNTQKSKVPPKKKKISRKIITNSKIGNKRQSGIYQNLDLVFLYKLVEELT